MNILCAVLAVSLVVTPSETCIPTPPPPTPSPTPTPTPAATPTPTPTPTPAPTPVPTTTTAAHTTTTAAPTTTTAAPECPLGGETSKGSTCVGDSNILKIETSITSVTDCEKKCEDYKDGDVKCTFWSFRPKRQFCFLLNSCEKAVDEEGVVSGAKGCKPPSKSFTVWNLVGAELTDCVAKWDPTDNCPDQDIGTDKKIAVGGSASVTYYAAPPSLGCAKLLKTTLCKWGTEECKPAADIDVPIKANLYVKKTLADATKCEIADNSKASLG